MRKYTAFTLIELLAVVAIAALVVTLATASLSAASKATEVLKTRSGLAQMDARGRLHARASGEPVWLRWDSDAHIVRLIGRTSGTQLAELIIPSEIDFTMALTASSPFGSQSHLKYLLFDRRGVSRDYQIELGGHDHATLRMQVAGLTGEITQSEVTP